MKKTFLQVIGWLWTMMALLPCLAQETDHNEQDPSHSKDTSQMESKMLYALPSLDHGLIQSPINILTHDALEGAHKIIVNEYDSEAKEVVNAGHTVQLNFEKGSSIAYDGKTFHFLQCHFHTPSEHQLDGVTFPMEAHFVHSRKDPDHPEAPEYLVIGVWFKMGEASPFMEKFISRIPHKAHESQTLENAHLRFGDLIHEEEMEHYYAYKGSLTTPPYTETVNWLVLRDIFQASPDQIRVINELEGDNARHVHAVFGRKLESH